MNDTPPKQPDRSNVNLLDAFALANELTKTVGGKDLALIATAFAVVLGRAAQTLPPHQVIVLQNHVCKYIADFSKPPQ